MGTTNEKLCGFVSVFSTVI